MKKDNALKPMPKISNVENAKMRVNPLPTHVRNTGRKKQTDKRAQMFPGDS